MCLLVVCTQVLDIYKYLQPLHTTVWPDFCFETWGPGFCFEFRMIIDSIIMYTVIVCWIRHGYKSRVKNDKKFNLLLENK